MQEVFRSGTARGVQARYNLTFPVAGKTGTSHDGWFAGYDSDLLCVVWVGLDDSQELDLEGAHSAAPIWAEFMKRAIQYRGYRDPKPFSVPGGIVSIVIDPESGMPATANCPKKRTEVYIAGTEPTGACPLHGGRPVTNIAGWDTSTALQAEAAAPSAGAPLADAVSGNAAAPPTGASRRPRVTAQKAQAPPEPPKQPEKKGFWRRLLGVFK
jgi:penicillin-binding protein 1B